MKRKLISTILAVIILFSSVPMEAEGSVVPNNTSSYVNQEYMEESCAHGVLYEFDDTTMTVNGVYEENLVQALLDDIINYAEDHHAVILKDGEEVTGGYLEEGMIVQVYHGDNLYGEYTIPELRKPFMQPVRQSRLARAATGNAYGFVLPIDNLVLLPQMSGNISSYYGWRTIWGEQSFHYGIDLAGGPNHPSITGEPIRAVKGGTVTRAIYGSDYGNHIKIDHGNGIVTLYGHMQSPSPFSVGQSVSQGDIIGYVGSTGQSTGAHLHFEVYVNGTRVDPLPYLTGAPTASSTANSCLGATIGNYCIGSSVEAGSGIYAREYLASPNGKFIALLQDDGNFVVYNSDKPLWAIGTSGTGNFIHVQDDGNTVLYDRNNTPLWVIGDVNTLEMQDDGNLVAYNIQRQAVWNIGTHSSGASAFDIVYRNECLGVNAGSYCIGSILQVGVRMVVDEYIASPDGRFLAKMQGDGNFVVYNSDRAVWASSTSGNGNFIQLQHDGNLVIYDAVGTPLWVIGDVNTLEMQDDGNLVAYNIQRQAVWNIGTHSSGASAFDIVYRP